MLLSEQIKAGGTEINIFFVVGIILQWFDWWNIVGKWLPKHNFDHRSALMQKDRKTWTISKDIFRCWVWMLLTYFHWWNWQNKLGSWLMPKPHQSFLKFPSIFTLENKPKQGILQKNIVLGILKISIWHVLLLFELLSHTKSHFFLVSFILPPQERGAGPPLLLWSNWDVFRWCGFWKPAIVTYISFCLDMAAQSTIQHDVQYVNIWQFSRF